MSVAAPAGSAAGPLAPLDRPWVRVLAFGLAHVALCRLGDGFVRTQGDFATFWPASGLFVGALVLAPRPHWRWYALAVLGTELVAGLVLGRSPWLAAAFGLAGVVEAVVGALLVRLAAAGPVFRRQPVRDVMGLVVLAAGLGSALVSLLGTAGLRLAFGTKFHFGTSWAQWWSGNALGTLVVAPVLLAWASPSRLWPRWTSRRSVEALGLMLAGTGLAWLVVGEGGQVHLGRGYLLLPVLGWAAFRFGLRGASLLGAAMALLSAWTATEGLSRSVPPGAPTAPGHEVQLLLAVSLTAALLLAASLEERAAADEARRESEALFGAFLDHSPAALFILDAAGRLRSASRSFERMMGRPAAELMGQRAEEALPDAEGRAAAAEDAAILASGAPVRVDRRLAGRVQDIVKFRIELAGRAPMVGAVAVDVTEQRLALRSVRLAQVALDRAFTALLFVEPSGLVTYANEAAGRLWGRPAGELTGRSIWELGPAFEEASWPAAWRALRAAGSLLVEGRVGLAGAPPVEAELGLSFVAFDGQEYAVFAARDLTERRQAEAAQRLAAVGTLAAGMAHEVNNPLTFVAANLAYALDRLGPLRGEAPADEAVRALEDAEEGTRRVARVVRDLKAVSRASPEERRPIDLRAEVETALKLAQNELRHRATVVEALGALPHVSAPDFQLGQVFLNLLVNAAQALGDGGPAVHTVRLATRTAPDGWAVVEVSDTGAGIPPEVLGRIFEPFFTTKPIGKGTGLGLSVCHGIVTGLGGRIEVESEPGRGSTFRVLLPPAGPAAPPPPPAAPRPRPEGGRARILVVDDEQLIGTTIRRLLSLHEVVALTDPREALARLRDGERFDLVLCDLMMPQLSGMELHEAVAAVRPEVARRMVFMTGGAFTDRAREFLERVGNPQLGKPFAPQDLRDQVRAWLAEARQQGGAAPPG